MGTSAAFTVYDASAGAGKTFTLVKNYLTIILRSSNKNKFRQILAVTFTNKAVAEMKTRILESLHGFSLSQTPAQHRAMFLALQDDLKLSEAALRQQSKEVLHYILHNYAAFNVQTIDKFTQSVIRTFAFDLGIATNFEVELDQKRVLERAIDQLLAKVGTEAAITKMVVDYTKSEINKDKSWNLKQRLLNLSYVILQENDAPYVEALSDLNLTDFIEIKRELASKQRRNVEKIKSEAQDILQSFQDQGIVDKFKASYIPKHFTKLLQTGSDTYTAGWKKDISTADFYNKNTDAAAKQAIDNLRPQIELVITKLKHLVFENQLLEAIEKNSTQLALLKSINEEIQILKKQEQFLLISDFNHLIFEQVKNQPTPFIYERIGERYKHFFIDEFQDTSVLQWENLKPLCDNAVSSLIENEDQSGTVSIVGDAKQAIYSWRGGKASQFVNLSQQKSPFANPDKDQILLETNYRSYSNIIDFNNAFFSYLSQEFSNTAYAEIYQRGSDQKHNHKAGGYVEFSFIDAANAEAKNEQYCERVLQTIQKVLQQGYAYKDIALLVRKNKEGQALATYLTQQNIPVLSFEALLVKNAKEVHFLECVLQLIVHPLDKKYKLNFLKAAFHFMSGENYHHFISENLALNLVEMEYNFSQKGKNITFNSFNELGLYEALEQLLSDFNLNKTSNANLLFFMDFVYEFVQTHNTGIAQFLRLWEDKKQQLSVIVPEGTNAVQIMSIHKSKGLEFPIVIYPFADTEVYDFKMDSVWYPSKDLIGKLDFAYIKVQKEVLEQYSDESSQILNHLKQQKELDNFNLLYVALTRAAHQLYVISNGYESKNGLPSHSFPYYFKNYLKQSSLFNSANEDTYFFGEPLEHSAKKGTISLLPVKADSFHYRDNNLYVVTTKEDKSILQQAKDYGIFIHEILAKVGIRKDVTSVLAEYRNRNIFEPSLYVELLEVLEAITTSPQLESCFSGENEIYNERDFYFQNEILRPDRVEITPNAEVYIIDYKTGVGMAEYKSQLDKYELIFRNLGYKVIKKYLIYVKKPIKIQEF